MYNKLTYKPMACPICDKYFFSEIEEGEYKDIEIEYVKRAFELLSRDKEEKPYCSHCGWKYDLDQFNNPDSKDGENELSLNEYKKWYLDRIDDNPNWDYDEANYVPTPHSCPVCGKYTFEDNASYDICNICGWEDDPVQLIDPDLDGGANDLSLNEYKKWYKDKIKEDKDWIFDNNSDNKNPHLCPICEKFTFSDTNSYEQCKICGWIDDPEQSENPNLEDISNELSLNQYKEKYDKKHK